MRLWLKGSLGCPETRGAAAVSQTLVLGSKSTTAICRNLLLPRLCRAEVEQQATLVGTVP
jgi:hypothetical protein